MARIHLIESVKRAQDMRKAHERELQDLARRLEASNLMWLRVASLDSLTAIPNRQRFEDALEQAAQERNQEAMRSRGAELSSCLNRVEVIYGAS